jgi:hypothetical protein
VSNLAIEVDVVKFSRFAASYRENIANTAELSGMVNGKR